MLLASELHASLKDPVLDSINFLNGIISRFPKAISFAPGAPNPIHLQEIDINRYVSRYIQYLCHNKGFEVHQAYRNLYEYGPTKGLINDLIATAIDRDKGFKVAPETIVITVGAQEAMLMVLRVLFRSSYGRLAVVTPCFVGILGAARLLDIDVVGVSEGNEGIDLDELDQICKISRQNQQPIRALYVAPDYSNPAGTVLTLEIRRQLLKLAEHHDFLLLEDNAYGFTSPPGKEIPPLKALDESKRVIFLGTFAKICLPGARVGYVIADQEVNEGNEISHRLADHLTTVKSMITLNTSPICQAIIAGMLIEENGSFAALERARSDFYRKNLALLLDALKYRLSPGKNQSLMGVSWNYPTGGFFIRMCLPIPADMALLEFSASNFGVLWTPMSPFYLNHEGRNQLRLSCSYLTAEQIEEGVDRLANFLHTVITKKPVFQDG